VSVAFQVAVDRLEHENVLAKNRALVSKTFACKTFV